MKTKAMLGSLGASRLERADETLQFQLNVGFAYAPLHANEASSQARLGASRHGEDHIRSSMALGDHRVGQHWPACHCPGVFACWSPGARTLP
ncbi:hypothetical protein C8Q80DRAFT_1166474 [Daedaleopsis nitida]|nr:hypothetical protein C8Q80DRAFT_1166474 [Daedaleopsis nitida]